MKTFNFCKNFLLITGMVVFGALPLRAEPALDQSTTLMPPKGMSAMPSEPFQTQESKAMVFGFPGTDCPAGSEHYNSPEAFTAEAENEGVVYCAFIKKYIPVSKSATKGTCPGGGKPFQADGFDQDPDVVWCDADALKHPTPLGTKPIRNVPAVKSKK